MLIITKYCRIESGICRVDGETLYAPGNMPVKEFLSGLYRNAGIDYPKFFKMDVLAKAGFLVAELLLKGVNTGNGQNTGIFLANSSSSLDTDRHYQDTIGEAYFPSPSVFVYTLPNIVLGEICIRHKIYGENTFFVSPEFQSAFLCEYVRTVFEEVALKHALVGWLECCGEKCEVLALWVERGEEGIEFTKENIDKLK